MSADIPSRDGWKKDLARYLAPDRAQSLRQIASVVLPYLAIWVLAVIVQPGTWVAVGLGLVATVFLMRMYSLFHDLTHNSMFESRTANSRWGHAARVPPLHPLPLVAAPAQPSPRAYGQPRQARAGRDLHDDARRIQERVAPAADRLPRVPEPAADDVRRPGARLPVRSPLPAARHVAPDSPERHRDQPRARGVGARLERARRVDDLPADPGHDAGGRRGRRRLDALHPAPVRGDLLPGGRRVAVRARRASGQLVPEAPARARLGRRQRQLPPRASPQRADPQLPPSRRARGAADVRAHAGGHDSQQHRRAAPEALGRGARVAWSASPTAGR